MIGSSVPAASAVCVDFVLLVTLDAPFFHLSLRGTNVQAESTGSQASILFFSALRLGGHSVRYISVF
jgi:hypothetical protein